VIYIQIDRQLSKISFQKKNTVFIKFHHVTIHMYDNFFFLKKSYHFIEKKNTIMRKIQPTRYHLDEYQLS